jgi:hypothetical protein
VGFQIITAEELVVFEAFFTCRSRDIYPANWIIAAVGKHVIAQHALAGGYEGIGVEEAAQFGIIIAALQIIEPAILDIA